MATTYEPIATTTLGSAAASITFSSISSAYTDLRLILTCSWNSNDKPILRINSDTGSNYSRTLFYGNGSTITNRNRTTADDTNIALMYELLGANNVITSSVDFFSYTGSTYKTLLYATSADANGSGYVERGVGMWLSTSSISSLNLVLINGSNFAAGSTATLYGILKA
jgi:hypothetical protein